MANKMLIDATHPEETRVVVVKGQRVEEFDFESANRRPLRGNIYLAKVARVEPSLQAAFIEYGGNRHGFLAFGEIHPDYYQIPIADQQALRDEEAAHAAAADESENGGREDDNRRSRGRRRRSRVSPRRSGGDATRAAAAVVEGDEASPSAAEGVSDAASHDADDAEASASRSTGEAVLGENEDAVESTFADVSSARGRDGDFDPATGSNGTEPAASASEADDGRDGQHANRNEGDGQESDGHETVTAEARAPREDEPAETDGDDDGGDEGDDADDDAEGGDDSAHDDVEQIGGEDALDDVPDRPRMPRRNYKIQEVIKRGQKLLVQVVKEERGNKGAALTTYLSLAGRYSVLMPNTARGGGISRKIADNVDRRRLKELVQELDVPPRMGVILRTAGASRTKTEIKRDFEYLLRMWEEVRETTFKSTAPSLVYEEGSLIKRAVRDLYGKEVDEILVAGEEGYRDAKAQMRMLMPSHARHVIAYRDAQPLFARYGVEAQLDAMFSNHVTLKSGGYLVINQTEALVSIDVNSGRSTREHNIEDTALKTNLEAADEIARQLRLRDLAGLIVIDFIDMDESRNDKAVERRLKDALKNDRARIQIGRISAFGLLEMSRQRIRQGVVESSVTPCPHCAASGFVRSAPSVALQVLRAVEELLIKNNATVIRVGTTTEVALYLLNQKRGHLRDLEDRYGAPIQIEVSPEATGAAPFQCSRGMAIVPNPRVIALPPPIVDEDDDLDDVMVEDETEEAVATAAPEESVDASTDAEAGESAEAAGRRRRRRRRGRGRTGLEAGERAGGEDAAAPDEIDADDDKVATPSLRVAEDEEAAAEGEGATPAGDDAGADGPRRRRGRRGGRRGRREGLENGVAASDGADADGIEPTDEPDAPEAMNGEISRLAPLVDGEAMPLAASAEDAPAPLDEAATVTDAPAEATAAPEPKAAPAAVAAVDVNEPAPRPDDVPSPPAPPARPAEPETYPIPQDADPDRPKRGGWWARAKAAIGG